VHAARRAFVPGVEDVSHEDGRGIRGVRQLAGGCISGDELDHERALRIDLDLLERQVADRTAGCGPRLTRIELDLDAARRAQLAADAIGLTPPDWRERVALIRIIAAPTQPEVEHAKVRIVRILQQLGFERLDERTEQELVAARALELAATRVAGCRPNRLLCLAQAPFERVEGGGEDIGGRRSGVGRRGRASRAAAPEREYQHAGQ
jgi:hypothetical protein